DPAWRIFDCRFSLTDPSAGHNAWLASHIPGAMRADIDEHLSADHVAGLTGRHPLPSMEAWLAQLRSWGLSNDMQIVAYDDSGGLFAARLWWMLRWAGHEAVAVLDGGWQDWLVRGTGVTDAAPAPAPPVNEPFVARPPLTRLVEARDIDAASQVLIDARDAPRFRGEREPIDPVAGHIPGARSAPVGGNLDATGFFRPRAALRRRFEALLDGRAGGDAVCYCGSGITAAHNVLALRHAGFDEPLLYAGSWSEWITDPRRGVAVGE